MPRGRRRAGSGRGREQSNYEGWLIECRTGADAMDSVRVAVAGAGKRS
jgi:hypothetical protein